MEKLSDRVRLRMSKIEGMTQKKLANMCGVEQPTINRLLNGKTKNPPFIYELAKALETSVKWLKTGFEDNANSPPQGGTNIPRGFNDGAGYKGSRREVFEVLDIWDRWTPEQQKEFLAIALIHQKQDTESVDSLQQSKKTLPSSKKNEG